MITIVIPVIIWLRTLSKLSSRESQNWSELYKRDPDNSSYWQVSSSCCHQQLVQLLTPNICWLNKFIINIKI